MQLDERINMCLARLAILSQCRSAAIAQGDIDRVKAIEEETLETESALALLQPAE